MANIPLGGQIQVGSKTANVDAKYGPYASRAEAMEILGEEGMDAITVGLTVGIEEDGKIVEYWWQGGVELEHLVKKYDMSSHDEEVNDIHFADSKDNNDYPDITIL